MELSVPKLWPLAVEFVHGCITVELAKHFIEWIRLRRWLLPMV